MADDDEDGMSFKIVNGDCLKVLQAMEDESVDAVITDPPYGLGSEPSVEQMVAYLQGDEVRLNDKDFMGKDWAIPTVSIWKECLRVLKPGGHLLAFAGSRTQDLIGLGIRAAGFECRDTLMWIYGCLTPDVEILTAEGWKLGVDIEEGDEIAQWDPLTTSVSLAPVEQTFKAQWDGPMRVLRNSDTDQLLTPNHRVYHKTSVRTQVDGVRKSNWPDDWQILKAEDVSRHQPTKLPLAGLAEGAGIGGEEYAALLGWVWTEGGFDDTGSGVRIYQSSVNRPLVEEISDLVGRQVPTHKKYSRGRVYKSRAYTEHTWFFTGEAAKRVREDLPNKHPTYSLIWRMTLAEKEAFLDAAMKGDGSGWKSGNQQFSQKSREDLDWFQTLLHLTGRSGKVTMRRNRDNGTVYLRNGSTTEVQSKHFKNHPDLHYTGPVWCVKVPTGAFLAKRNGMIFITGNSGFPKSSNISKQIDKSKGVKPTVVGKNPNHRPGSGTEYEGVYAGKNTGNEHLTAPTSDEAKEWEGWGTALKPSYEPIIMARKPFKGAAYKNVMEHGTGALNIDATRIPTKQKLTRKLGKTTESESGWKSVKRSEVAGKDGGRWPANVLLDEDSAEVLDEQSGILTSGSYSGKRKTDKFNNTYGSFTGTKAEKGRTGSKGGASRFFYQSKASKKEKNEGVDGKNNHPTVKPVSLMQWLVKLVTPPGGTVLDPYCGSGTTGVAAVEEGFDFIGIEIDSDYVKIAEQRVKNAISKKDKE